MKPHQPQQMPKLSLKLRNCAAPISSDTKYLDLSIFCLMKPRTNKKKTLNQQTSDWNLLSTET